MLFLVPAYLFAMSKEAIYFSHDYNARNDPRLMRLIMKEGMEGIGIYWCIIEMLYEEDGILPTEYDRIAFDLRTDADVIKSVVNDFELFVVNEDCFYSESVNKRLKIRADKSEKARESVNKRWERYERNTGVLPSNEDRNTIKEKNSKVNNNQKETFENLRDQLFNMAESQKMQIALSIKDAYPKAGIPFINAMIGRFTEYLLAKDDIYEPVKHYRMYFVNWLKNEIKKDKDKIDKIYQEAIRYEKQQYNEKTD